ncbi:MAG: hypothetical protein J3K34DRAFT_508101 [Monoraphidium minutum]|nr:MAG: hypothetical protein J3K34DRAFT_508101 [Monoraphidium minutum]
MVAQGGKPGSLMAHAVAGPAEKAPGRRSPLSPQRGAAPPPGELRAASPELRPGAAGWPLAAGAKSPSPTGGAEDGGTGRDTLQSGGGWRARAQEPPPPARAGPSRVHSPLYRSWATGEGGSCGAAAAAAAAAGSGSGAGACARGWTAPAGPADDRGSLLQEARVGGGSGAATGGGGARELATAAGALAAAPASAPAAPAACADGGSGACASPAAAAAAAAPALAWPGLGLEEETSQLLAPPALPDGRLDAEALRQQQLVLSAAFSELCRQVSVGCVERGRLMAQCWLSLGGMLAAALADRAAALGGAAAAARGEAGARREAEDARQRAREEVTALRVLMERHAAKAAEARREAEAAAEKSAQLEVALARLTGVQHLVERVEELEAANLGLTSDCEQLRAARDAAEAGLAAAEAAAADAARCAAAAEADEGRARARLGASTPRPRRDMGLLSDLLTQQELALVERALIAGVPAEHVHRMLLALTPGGADVGPWGELLGCCRPALDAQPTPEGRARVRAELHALLAACDAGALAAYVPPGAMALLARAVHVGTDRDTLMSLMDGSLGCPGGADCSPYLPLLGALSRRYGHDASELGGAVTAALAHAALSTRGRMEELVERSKALHRELVMCKRALADQRKHEAERLEAALRDQQRQIMRRSARPLSLVDKFLQTKWGDYFTGIGVFEDLPRVLRSSAPINNKRMSKREAERLVQEVWAAKDEQQALTGHKARGGVRGVAYNVVYSLGQHSYDADCNLFLRIFCGDVEEGVRQEQAALEEQVLTTLRLVDVAINHQATGWLHKGDVKTALAGFFKGSKKVDRLDEVYEALDTDEPGAMVAYTRLFDDDSDMNQARGAQLCGGGSGVDEEKLATRCGYKESMFAETVRGQCLAERLEYLQARGRGGGEGTGSAGGEGGGGGAGWAYLAQEIEDTIRDFAEDNATTDLTPAMAAAALKKAHKGGLNAATIDAFVARAFGPDWRARERSALASLSHVVRAVRRGSLGSADAASGGAAAARGASGGGAAVEAGGAFGQRLATAMGRGPAAGGGAHNGRAATAGARRVSVGGGTGAAERRKSREGSGAAGRRTRAAGEPAAGAHGKRAAAGGAEGGGPPGGHAAPGGARSPSRRTTMEAPAAAQRSRSPRSGASASGARRPPPLDLPAAAPDDPAAAAGGGPRTARGACAAAAAAAPPLTPAVLTAMEAVRQSWLLEEHGRTSSSGGGGGGGSSGGGGSAGSASGTGGGGAGPVLSRLGGGGGGGDRCGCGAGDPGTGGWPTAAQEPAPAAHAARHSSDAGGTGSPRAPPPRQRFTEGGEPPAPRALPSDSGCGGGRPGGRPLLGILKLPPADHAAAAASGAPPSPLGGGGSSRRMVVMACDDPHPGAARLGPRRTGSSGGGGAAAAAAPEEVEAAPGPWEDAALDAARAGAPAAGEGGKRAAALFRKASKRGSVWRLQEVMLQVAEAVSSPGAGAAAAAAPAPWA